MESRDEEEQVVRVDDWSRRQFVVVYSVFCFLMFLAVIVGAFGPESMVVQNLSDGQGVDMQTHMCTANENPLLYGEYDNNLLVQPRPSCYNHKLQFRRQWTNYFHLDLVAGRPENLRSEFEVYPIKFGLTWLGTFSDSYSKCKERDHLCTEESTCANKARKCQTDAGHPCSYSEAYCLAPVHECANVCSDSDDCCEEEWREIANRTSVERRVHCLPGMATCEPASMFRSSSLAYNKYWFEITLEAVLDQTPSEQTPAPTDEAKKAEEAKKQKARWDEALAHMGNVSFVFTHRSEKFSQYELSFKYAFCVVNILVLVWFTCSSTVAYRATARRGGGGFRGCCAWLVSRNGLLLLLLINLLGFNNPFVGFEYLTAEARYVVLYATECL